MDIPAYFAAMVYVHHLSPRFQQILIRGKLDLRSPGICTAFKYR
jgi:hypothetical protein